MEVHWRIVLFVWFVSTSVCWFVHWVCSVWCSACSTYLCSHRKTNTLVDALSIKVILSTNQHTILSLFNIQIFSRSPSVPSCPGKFQEPFQIADFTRIVSCMCWWHTVYKHLFQQDGWFTSHKHFDVLTYTRLQPQIFRQHFEHLINTRTTSPPLSATLSHFKI